MVDPGYKDVPELWNLGFPYADVNENGDLVLHKLPDTGGLLSEDTVKEQLIYEIQDPTKYYTPDVIADFSNVTVHGESDGIHVSGATGTKKTGQLKVSVGYEDGYIVEGGVNYGGHNAFAKAKLANEIVKKRLDMIGIKVEKELSDYIGVNSLITVFLSPVNRLMRFVPALPHEPRTKLMPRKLFVKSNHFILTDRLLVAGFELLLKIAAIASIIVPKRQSEPC